MSSQICERVGGQNLDIEGRGLENHIDQRRIACRPGVKTTVQHERLREARKRAGYKRREDVVAALGDGFSAGSLHRWENNDVAPPFEKIARLAELFDVSLDWLAGRTDCSTSHHIDHGKLIVDKDGLDRVNKLAVGASVDEVMGPRFHCVWTLPKRFIVMNGSAAEDVERHLATKVKVLLQERTRERGRAAT